MKYSDMYTLVPVEIDGPLQEVSYSLQEVVKQVQSFYKPRMLGVKLISVALSYIVNSHYKTFE